MKPIKIIQNLIVFIAFFIAFALIGHYAGGFLLDFVNEPWLDVSLPLFGIGLILLSIYLYLKSAKPKPTN
jgi:uncharacterized membrane protein YfcA